MVRVHVTETPELRRVIRVVAGEISDLRPIWQELEDDLLKSELVQVFETEGRGTWQPRKDNLTHPLLRKTGVLFRSIVETPRTISTPNSYEFGTDVEYAEYHEEDTLSIPARPFFMILEDDADFDKRVGDLIDSAVQRNLNLLAI